MQGGMKHFIPPCIPISHLYRVTNARCRIGTVFSPDDEHTFARNMYRKAINILKKIVYQFGSVYKFVQGCTVNKTQNYTDTILICNNFALPQQLWLRDRAKLLLNTYIANFFLLMFISWLLSQNNLLCLDITLYESCRFVPSSNVCPGTSAITLLRKAW